MVVGQQTLDMMADLSFGDEQGGISERDRSSTPVRVCFVIENLIPAGTELWVTRLIQQLDRQRVQPSLCVLDGRSDQSRRLEPENCPVLRLGLNQLKTPRALPAARRFLRFLSEQRVEVVQVHHADPTYFAVPLAHLAGIPRIVQTKYDVGYWLTGVDLWLHRRMRRWIDATIANCEACRVASIAQEGSPPHSVHVVQNGIPLEDLLTIPPLRAADWPSEPHVAMVANLRPIKDPETYLYAAQLVLREFPRVTFHVAGEGPMYGQLQQLAAELGLGDRLKLHGHVVDTTGFLAQTQLFVLSSRSEGLPHALLEAMAAGRAVVATRVGGNVELIEDELSGLLVPPENPHDLAQAILRLLRNPVQAERMGRSARQQVSQRYSLQAMSRRFENFYERLLGRTIGEHVD